MRSAFFLATTGVLAACSGQLTPGDDVLPYVPTTTSNATVAMPPACESAVTIDAPEALDARAPDASGVPEAGPGLGDATSDASPDVITGASPLEKPRVFVYGNSLVWGSGMTSAEVATDRFPAQLAEALGDRWQSDLWVGRGGWPTSMLITAARHDLAAANAETNRTRKVLVFWEGTNEMGSPWNCEAYEIMTRKRVSEGWSVVLINALVRPITAEVSEDGGAAPNPYWRDLSRAFNQCVVDGAKSWGASAVVDVRAIPELQNPYDATYFIQGVPIGSDRTHLTKAGYARVVARVAPILDSLYVAP